jgi:DNA-binding MurR/RpiR family transcriptional regulator
LQQIAKFTLDYPDDMALETVAVIADRAGVQPSALIRFGKTFGFDGFSDMQRVFRSRLLDQGPRYRDRIRRLRGETDTSLDSAEGILGHFIEAGTDALNHLRDEIAPRRLEQAVDILMSARTIHVIGHRRAFSTASYFAYAFSQLGCSCHLIDNIGGMSEMQAQQMGAGDVLIAISFHSYAAETLKIAQRAARDGIPIVAITDAPLSPLDQLATIAFAVEDAQVRGFRSLTATMCLAVTLVVALGQRMENQPRALDVHNT